MDFNFDAFEFKNVIPKKVRAKKVDYFRLELPETTREVKITWLCSECGEPKMIDSEETKCKCERVKEVNMDIKVKRKEVDINREVRRILKEIYRDGQNSNAGNIIAAQEKLNSVYTGQARGEIEDVVLPKEDNGYFRFKPCGDCVSMEAWKESVNMAGLTCQYMMPLNALDKLIETLTEIKKQMVESK